MKISYSTLATPNVNWSEISSIAKDFGYQGVEIRGIGKDLYAYKAKPFLPENINRTVEKMKQMKIEVPCYSLSCCLKYADKREENKAEIIRYMELAKITETPYLRVLGDLSAKPEGEEVDDEVVISQLKELAPIAAEYGITILIESNGVYADTKRLRRLLEHTASDNVAALWDMHHPYRIMGESPEETIQNLGAYIKHVHIKDSVVENGEFHYKLMGEGDMPIDEMMSALRSINYEGYVSLEWVKRWSDELEDAGIAIPHYAHFMQKYMEQSIVKSELYSNKAGTGQYIWEKETLIDLTFPQLLDRVTEEFPDQYAFRYTEEGIDYNRTYAEFREDVDTFARSLISLGVKRGDKVAIWATNVPAWFITFWAATKIGAVLVTVNTAYKIHEAEYLLRQSDTHTLVMIEGFKDSHYAEIVKELCPELESHTAGEPLYTKKLPFLRNVITAGFEMKGAIPWEKAQEYSQNTPIEIVYQRMAMINRHDVCNMQYTSGTTGFPKGVMLTHYNVVNNGKCIGDRMDLSTADRFLIEVPMFHCFGMVLTMTSSVTHGSTMVPITSYSPVRSLNAITKEKITACNGVPTMFIGMLENELFDKTDFSHMRTGIMAGSPCPVKVMEDVLEKMHMTDITIVFGQTESSPGCTMSSSDDSVEVKVNTVGRPLPGIECKVIDPITGDDLPDNEAGEFVARGYNIMKGYYKMPAATADAIDENGWLHTGDLAVRRPDGNFKITGRIKDMIIRGGENIYPKEIEDFLYTHEAVKDVQVIGVPDKQYGEEIMACVILKEGASITEEEITAYVRDNMAKQKVPKYVRFVDSFPMNAAGKIMKYKMVEDAVDFLGLQQEKSIETA